MDRQQFVATAEEVHSIGRTPAERSYYTGFVELEIKFYLAEAEETAPQWFIRGSRLALHTPESTLYQSITARSGLGSRMKHGH